MRCCRSLKRRAAMLCCAALAAFVPAALGAPPAGDSTLGDPLRDHLPGRESIASLRHALDTPDAQSRWRGLPQFGRDLFRGADQQFTPIENTPVGPDYVLGPGDNLMVFVSGLTDTSFSLTLDREGKVFLPRSGATFLWGLRFADGETLIKARIASVLRNARVQVSMGRVRALETFVLGAVERPGKYTLTGMATAFHAVSAAGGPSALGSLRDIRVLRGERVVARLDLYRFLTHGDRSNDVRLEAGDVVFVGLARSQVGIQGAVVRPGVYESDGPLSLRSLMDLAGGATPFADLTRIRVERVDANGGFRLQDLPLDHGHGVDPDSLTLSNYDLVTLLPLRERVQNVVTLDGYVRHPGEYELAAGLTLAQLVARERLLPEAELDLAELRRVDPATFAVEVLPFSVRKLWAGEGDLALRPMDAVSIFSGARFPRSITLEGEITHPGTYTFAAGERLSDVLKRSGGVTPQGWLAGAAFVRLSTRRQEDRVLRDFVKRQRIALAEQQAQLAQSGDSASAGALVRAQADLVAALQERSDPGRIVLDLDERGRWMNTAGDPVLEDGDRFKVPVRPVTVTVVGSVMNPGTLMAVPGKGVGDYLRMAGGPAREADVGRSYVLRANGEALPRRARLRVEPGDAIVVPPRPVSAGGLGRSLTGGARFLMEFSAAAALVFAAARR